MICDKHGCAVEEAKENDRRAQAASIAIEQASRDRADAERFRWLEEHTVATGLSRWMGREQFLSVAVDKAMARGKPPNAELCGAHLAPDEAADYPASARTTG